MMLSYFHILHVFSLFMLFGVCAAAAASPVPEKRKKFLMWSGIASLVAVLSGFGMAGMLKIGFPLWIWIKIFCWLALSVLVGLFFRAPSSSRNLLFIAMSAVFFAIAVVYLRPS
jgi:hypothetical protein